MTVSRLKSSIQGFFSDWKNPSSILFGISGYYLVMRSGFFMSCAETTHGPLGLMRSIPVTPPGGCSQFIHPPIAHILYFEAALGVAAIAWFALLIVESAALEGDSQ